MPRQRTQRPAPRVERERLIGHSGTGGQSESTPSAVAAAAAVVFHLTNPPPPRRQRLPLWLVPSWGHAPDGQLRLSCGHLRLWPVFLCLAGLVVQQRRRVRLCVDGVAADVDPRRDGPRLPAPPPSRQANLGRARTSRLACPQAPHAGGRGSRRGGTPRKSSPVPPNADQCQNRGRTPEHTRSTHRPGQRQAIMNLWRKSRSAAWSRWAAWDSNPQPAD
jgi:hypothetical protein